jgi:hypothetical protein
MSFVAITSLPGTQLVITFFFNDFTAIRSKFYPFFEIIYKRFVSYYNKLRPLLKTVILTPKWGFYGPKWFDFMVYMA